jgi:tetratricopeptide (TPR) repeat protein
VVRPDAGPWTDIFQLQDSLTTRIVESLSAPLSEGERQRAVRDVPARSGAYEHFLRANQIVSQPKEYRVARGLYEQCVAEDPNYAPAWVWLRRLHRVIAKIEEIDDAERHAEGYWRAEEAFARARTLNPELPLLHHFITPLELESDRALPSLLRLLDRAKRNAVDPQLRTAVIFTFSVMGRYEDAIAVAMQEGWDPDARAECVVRAGRMEEAVQACDEALQLWSEMRTTVMRIRDPEARYLWDGNLMLIGEDDQAAELLVHAVKTGYHCFPAMLNEPLFDPLRTRPEVREHL